MWKNCSVNDFNFYISELDLVTNETWTNIWGLTISFILGILQERCELCFTFWRRKWLFKTIPILFLPFSLLMRKQSNFCLCKSWWTNVCQLCWLLWIFCSQLGSKDKEGHFMAPIYSPLLYVISETPLGWSTQKCFCAIIHSKIF